ncbi:1-phosphofructokinase family hexose kinase [Feifania hominis]|uniref:Tagatose-6-phosphate kinase n=1 Tax=Feifania hominis TaxID=2763660 RepID=A0A926DGK3_9FIRM|nr:1-phosphofructokinase family hexose kinase [Feifania hominis]MBC8536909.1 1-phosphofructokinase family hexose kinase [Feifania hominis]
MINTVTLNPAVDRILYLNRVQKNITNRTRSGVKTVGGKGTHVSMNLAILGIPSRAFGLAYGETGQYILRELEACGVETRFVYSPDRESRTNTLLIEDDHTCTTIAERGVTPTDSEIAALVSELRNAVADGDSLVLSGDASNFPDPTIYNRICRELRGRRLRVFLDASGETLREGLRESPYLIKPNLDELSALCGRSLESDGDVLSAIEDLAPYRIEVVAVSLGARGAIVKTPEGVFRAHPPEVEVCNTVGCGDCFLSGLLYGLESRLTSAQALAFATAVSSATAASPLSVGFDRGYAERLLPLCRVERLA